MYYWQVWDFATDELVYEGTKPSDVIRQYLADGRKLRYHAERVGV